MSINTLTGNFPIVTLVGSHSAKRFACSEVTIYQKEGCIFIRFEGTDGRVAIFSGNRSHGSLPTIDYFKSEEADVISSRHSLELNAVKELKRVLEFFDEPVNLKGLLPEKKAV